MAIPEIKPEHVKALSKHATARIIDGIVTNQKAIQNGGIDTPLRLCHFMAQLAHESAHFTVTREFASGAAYEGRKDLGNNQAGDGKRFRGRGLIQTTGRNNYKQATTELKKMDSSAPNFVDDPAQLEEFPWALLAGISFWQLRNINAPADRDDIVKVTKLINGGKNGLAERTKYLGIAKGIWMSGVASPPSPVHADTAKTNPVLKKGAEGPDVVELQNELIEAGFKVSADGDFGDHTDEAVKAFQEQNELKPDGIVGEATWAALIANKG